MNLHQMNAQYEPEADRILFRFNTRSGEVFLFHLTRRFVRVMWPVLADLLKGDVRRRAPEKSHAVNAMLGFEREDALSKADFRQSFETGDATFPLGESPLLLTRIQVKTAPRGGKIVSLLPAEGPGIELPAHPRFLHTFGKLIGDMVRRAQWDLALSDIGDSGAERPAGTLLH